ncbi:ROK family protein [Kribbella flavida DSM 17836]|uniref:ROK family protein n=1 Tax=Kribbella flavida (strain DSM 17836 / JCM 10339 / NBRC 14399) TaxID=479435 RepID=D2PXL1_KRIFD|nr:ROK family protein [Kribbella flavida]ADB31653.1 ROK family protein [Kribbella flavida DSM 17836]
MSDEATTVLGIDIGGTKMAAALVAADGRILTEDRIPTPRGDADQVFAALAELIGRVRGEVTPVAVGIGSAGPLDQRHGLVSPVNIVGWRNFPLVDRVRELVGGVPVELGVDGHCFALGESWTGAGRGVGTLLGIVVSTGVGAGIVMDGKPLLGQSGNAAHLGHMVVDLDGEVCACGSYGCVETYASGPRMVARAQRRGWRSGELVDAAMLSADAAAGDEIALAVFDDGAQALAAGIVATAVTVDLTTVVIGGGVAKAGPVLFDPVGRWVKRLAQLPFVADLTVEPAQLANAGLLGAARLAWATTA